MLEGVLDVFQAGADIGLRVPNIERRLNSSRLRPKKPFACRGVVTRIIMEVFAGSVCCGCRQEDMLTTKFIYFIICLLAQKPDNDKVSRRSDHHSIRAPTFEEPRDVTVQ